MTPRPWHPSSSIDALHKRAKVLRTIRDFFTERGALEVETPLLSQATVTDPHIHSMQVQPSSYYLQTSPEYAMKRLLAAGSGPIFQITKAFRQDEVGRLHNPEFTLLEWYRPGYDHHALMDEMDALLQLILHCTTADRISYQAIFQHYLQLNPHTAALEELQQCASQQGIVVKANITQRDTWLQILLSHAIEPQLGQKQPLFLYDFPASQAALAKIRAGNPALASRFEVYYKGMELANGFHELQNAVEQRHRFAKDLAIRQQLQLAQPHCDENFLAALAQGLPDCAGVALGIDRLLMIAPSAITLAETMSFDFTRA